jgi:hypothetical protein
MLTNATITTITAATTTTISTSASGHAASVTQELRETHHILVTLSP